VPLLIVTVVIDAFGLGMIDRRVYIMGGFVADHACHGVLRRNPARL
jgi:hypothetical protein